MSFAKQLVLQGAYPPNRCLRQAHSLMQFVHACVMAGRIFFWGKRLQRPCPNKQQQTGACVTCNVHRFRCPLLMRGCPPSSFTALSLPALRSMATRPRIYNTFVARSKRHGCPAGGSHRASVRRETCLGYRIGATWISHRMDNDNNKSYLRPPTLVKINFHPLSKNALFNVGAIYL